MDILIDPLTRDYVLAAGKRVRDPASGLGNAVYLRLMTPLGSYWADATLGSRLHELQREKDVARVARLAQQYAEQALQPLLDDARAQRIAVSVARQPGRLLLTVAVTTHRGQVVVFHHPVRVAG